MEYNEDDYLMISGIQHFVFCRRQWALIHIEQQWKENVWTVDGNLMHKVAHDSNRAEKRKDKIITRGIKVVSHRLGISGVCDVVEFHNSDEGINISGWEGLWKPYPVEYKRGEPKENNADILQLCAQAMCLEEMLCCEIKEGSLFYGEIRRRNRIVITDELREEVESIVCEMRDLYNRNWTPNVKRRKSCNACSLKDICLPELSQTISVDNYIDKYLKEDNYEEIT